MEACRRVSGLFRAPGVLGRRWGGFWGPGVLGPGRGRGALAPSLPARKRACERAAQPIFVFGWGLRRRMARGSAPRWHGDRRPADRVSVSGGMDGGGRTGRTKARADRVSAGSSTAESGQAVPATTADRVSAPGERVRERAEAWHHIRPAECGSGSVTDAVFPGPSLREPGGGNLEAMKKRSPVRVPKSRARLRSVSFSVYARPKQSERPTSGI